MSLFDDFRAASAELFAAFDAPIATITHKSPGVRTDADMAAGRIPSPVITTTTVNAVIGKKKMTATDGTVRMETVARMNGTAEIGDTLTLNGNAFTITEMDEVNPDQGGAMIYIAVLK